MSGPHRRIKSATILIVLIVLVAGSIAALAYQFFSYSSARIQDSALQSTSTSAQIQASDVANALGDKLSQIAGNLVIISDSHMLQEGDVATSQRLVDAAQNTTRAFTAAYTVIGANGVLLASSNRTNLGLNLNLADWTFFVQAKTSGTTFVDPHFVSLLNGRPYVVFARPVYLMSEQGPNRMFRGVVTGSIDFSVLGNLVRSQLASRFHAQLGIVDYNGTILFAARQRVTSGRTPSAPKSKTRYRLPSEVRSTIFCGPLSVDSRWSTTSHLGARLRPSHLNQ